MRAAPLWPSVELLWSHETCEGCVGMGGADACGRRHRGLRWSSYGATKRVRGVPKFVAQTDALGLSVELVRGHETFFPNILWNWALVLTRRCPASPAPAAPTLLLS